MARSRSFNFPVRLVPDEPSDDGGPFPLEINGDEVMCVGAIDGLVLLEFTAMMRSDYFGTGDRARAMVKFLQKCIVEGQWEHFEEVIAKHQVDIENLGDICGYLAEVYSTYPTTPAPSSTAGQTTDGASSEETSSDEALSLSS